MASFSFEISNFILIELLTYTHYSTMKHTKEMTLVRMPIESYGCTLLFTIRAN